jgi:hypothetical protein
MCMLVHLQWPSWKIKKSRTAAEAGNYFRDRVYGRPIEGIIVTEDGHCADEMNRNIWCAAAATLWVL